MAAREAAMSTGALPHELMLGWARGEPRSRKVPGPDSDKSDPSTWITEYLPVEPDEMDGCAKAAAPYFAPKMSTVELINGVSDDDLNQLLESAAKEAGFDLAAFGEGTQGTGEDDQAE